MSSVVMAGLNTLHKWQFFFLSEHWCELSTLGWQWVVITSHIRQHLHQHSILSTLQHGFRKSSSCKTQLLVTLQDLFSYRDKNIQIDLAVLDFSKAIDTVPHKCMLGKLSHYGIKGPVLHWIRAFFADRTQLVVFEDTNFPLAPVLSGIPQGTVWEPLLFLCHINDLPSVVNSLAPRLFQFNFKLVIFKLTFVNGGWGI